MICLPRSLTTGSRPRPNSPRSQPRVVTRPLGTFAAILPHQVPILPHACAYLLAKPEQKSDAQTLQNIFL